MTTTCRAPFKVDLGNARSKAPKGRPGDSPGQAIAQPWVLPEAILPPELGAGSVVTPDRFPIGDLAAPLQGANLVRHRAQGCARYRLLTLGCLPAAPSGLLNFLTSTPAPAGSRLGAGG